ncbi:MAG TPA: VOC family protein [Roseiarcus sp.]|nr:VOC family protein [Roseiarcus sp.]
MNFASTRLTVADIKTMVGFYEMLTGARADWLAPVFAEIVTPSATLAFNAAETVAVFKEGSAEPAANRSATLEFLVADVDAEFARLKDKAEVVFEPKTMPWGNRCAQFRDPEGTLVALFAPVTEAAKARFGQR